MSWADSLNPERDDPGFREILDLYHEQSWFGELIRQVSPENIHKSIRSVGRRKIRVLRRLLRNARPYCKEWEVEREIFFGIYGQPSEEAVRKRGAEVEQFQRAVELLKRYFESTRRPWWKRTLT